MGALRMIEQEIRTQAEAAKAASYALAALRTDVRNAALEAMADALMEHTDAILHENAADVSEAKEAGMRASYIDRLHLDAERVALMAEGLRLTAALPDPLGREDYSVRRPNGLEIRRMRVPLGVIGMIYEARPNVTADAIGLCLKSGNAVVLRGGSDALRSNRAIAEVLSRAAYAVGIPSGAVQLLAMKDRSAVDVMTHLTGLIDVLIPRGGAGLIRAVVENAHVPVIETGTGICHVYIDRDADLDMALNIIDNAKTSRPSVCNAAEVCLVHRDIAAEFLPRLQQRLVAERQAQGLTPVALRLDDAAQQWISGQAAAEADFDTEFSDYILAVKIVDSVEAAVAHIDAHSTRHSDAVVTANADTARYFAAQVDSAAVYINASTRFTDGGEFGLGCEMGIATQKLHARGPMGLEEMTTYKYIVHGTGQVRA